MVKRNQKSIIVFAGLTVLIAGIAFLNKDIFFKSIPTPSIQPVAPTIGPSVVVEKYKTYLDNDYGFAIQYPGSWIEVVEKAGEETVSSKQTILTPETGRFHSRGIHIYVMKNEAKRSAREYFDEVVIPKSKGCGNVTIITDPKIFVDDDVIMARGFCGGGNPGPVAFIEYGEYVIELHSDSITDQEAFDIIKTFMFTR